MFSGYRRCAGIVAAAALALTAAACGGGGSGDAGVPAATEAAATVVVGPITGFGSVIVNGIRFDDSASQVTDDGGEQLPGGREALRLGMMVEVHGSIGADPGLGVATRIAVRGELQGPIDSVDAAGGTLQVFGVTVRTTAATLFAGIDGLVALRAGDLVEVHGFRDPVTGVITATRIELRPIGPAVRLMVRGIVQDLRPEQQTFLLAVGERNVLVDYSQARVQPSASALFEGAWVKVVSSQLPDADVIRADRVQVNGPRHIDDRAMVEIEGYADQVSDDGLQFEIDGIPIDASAANFVRGRPSDVASGRLLEVKGRWQDGVLIAQIVKFEDVSGGPVGGGPGAGVGPGAGGGVGPGGMFDHGEGEFEVTGMISGFVSMADFVVRGTRIDASSATFERGTASGLGEGVRLEIKGMAGHGGVIATRIRFED
ncbi:MAG: hypothetical protein JSW68_03550 [Burkholderiales bacterium]|nr:MAG: hypothetical protein JSW68_03550 [Burkholderiales bacterium]